MLWGRRFQCLFSATKQTKSLLIQKSLSEDRWRRKCMPSSSKSFYLCSLYQSSTTLWFRFILQSDNIFALSLWDGTYTHSYVNAVIVIDWFILKKYLLFPFNYYNIWNFIDLLIFTLSINSSVCFYFENVHCYLLLIYDNLIVLMILLSILLLTLYIIIFQRQISGIKKCDISCWHCKWVHPGGTGWAIFFYPVL